MRAGKRAARREIQKHIDFTDGNLAQNHSIKGLSESNFRAAAFIRGKKRPRTHAVTQIAQFYVQSTAVSAGSPL
jgi:hypothetical protein